MAGGQIKKAFTYNVTTPPKVIEEGLTAGIMIMYYLAADGYTIKTPLFTIKFRVPGEYNGSETLAINEPKRVKVLVPSTLTEGVAYQVAIFTQSSAKHGGTRVKTMRDMRSEFLITAQK